MFPPMPRVASPAAWIANKALRIGTIATMPRWMRDLAGLRQRGLTDRMIRPVLRASFRIGASNATFQLMTLRLISKSTVPVVEPIFRQIPATNPVTLTPAEARARYGAITPLELYADLRSREAALEVEPA